MARIFQKTVLAGLAAIAASSAQAEVIQQDEGGFVTRDVAVVAASPMEAWVALITPSKWWNEAHSWSGDASNMTLTPQGGGCFCEKLPAQEDAAKVGLSGSVEHMTVVLALPEQVLRMRGGLGPLQSEPAQGVLTVTLRPVDGGTRILWEYVVGGYSRFDGAVIANAVDGVMSEQLTRLATHLGPLETPEEAPAAEDAAEAVEEYAEEATQAIEDAEEGPPKPSVEEAFGDMN